MNVKKIVELYINEHIDEYDGLCNLDELCGCGIEDLMPCYDCTVINCELAHSELVPEEAIELYGCEDGEKWYISGAKK